MKKQWKVEADGVQHEIEYTAGLKTKIIIDGEVHKVKSSNAFINVIDYGITFGDTECNLVVIGTKADLAVNGTFLDSKEAYKPLSNVPAFVWIFVGLSTLGGFFIGGILSLAIGLIMSSFYIQQGLKKKTGALIGCFIGCTLIQLIIFFLLLGSLS